MERFFKLIKGAGLTSRVVRGSMWLGIGGGFEQGLRFARNLILVRLLAPEAFGIMAIILAVNAIFESFTQIGIKEAIIQNPKGAEKAYLSIAWWLSALRSVCIFIVGIFIAPMVANFYEAPQIVSLLRFSLCAALFNGLISPGAYVALKEMKFGRWVLMNQGGGICGIISAIVLAFLMPGVWALVIGFITEGVVKAILSFIIFPYLPRFIYEREALQSLLRYARGMFGLPILTFIFMQGDIIVIGKLFPKNDLGLYSMAMSLSQVPALLISLIINPILMPVFSKIQAQNEKINNALIKTTTIILVVSFPVLLLVVFYSKDILTILYGRQYMHVAVPFAVLFSTTIIRTCSAPMASVYLGIGRPELHRLFTGVRALLIVSMIYPAVKFFGLTGAASAGFLSMGIAYFIQALQMRKLTGLDLQDYSSIFLKSVGLSLPVVLIWVVTSNLTSFHPVINLIAGFIGCLISYCLFVLSSFHSKIWLQQLKFK